MSACWRAVDVLRSEVEASAMRREKKFLLETLDTPAINEHVAKQWALIEAKKQRELEARAAAAAKPTAANNNNNNNGGGAGFLAELAARGEQQRQKEREAAAAAALPAMEQEIAFDD